MFGRNVVMARVRSARYPAGMGRAPGIGSGSPTPSDLPSTIDGRYRVERLLGRGGMAMVFAAYDAVRQRTVALKRLLALKDPQKKRRNQELFEREFLLLSQLAHPHIVQVYDFAIEDGNAYFTMELLGGRELQRLAPMPWRDACTIMRSRAARSRVCRSLFRARAPGARVRARSLEPRARALARAHRGDADASALADVVIEHMRATGFGKLHLASAHEVRARIALIADDEAAFKAHAEAFRELVSEHRSAALTAKCQRLLRDGSRTFGAEHVALSTTPELECGYSGSRVELALASCKVASTDPSCYVTMMPECCSSSVSRCCRTPRTLGRPAEAAAAISRFYAHYRARTIATLIA
jgi:hypothetical protein